MYNFIKKREHGLIRPLRLERAETTRRIYSLQLSKKKELALSHRGIYIYIHIYIQKIPAVNE